MISKKIELELLQEIEELSFLDKTIIMWTENGKTYFGDTEIVNYVAKTLNYELVDGIKYFDEKEVDKLFPETKVVSFLD